MVFSFSNSEIQFVEKVKSFALWNVHYQTKWPSEAFLNDYYHFISLFAYILIKKTNISTFCVLKYVQKLIQSLLGKWPHRYRLVFFRSLVQFTVIYKLGRVLPSCIVMHIRLWGTHLWPDQHCFPPFKEREVSECPLITCRWVGFLVKSRIKQEQPEDFFFILEID